MNAVQIIGACLAIWCVSSFAIGAIYAFVMWRHNARDQWPLHRDRQHRDRMRAQHLSNADEAEIAAVEGFGGHIHNGRDI
jgi:HAMP domain-containing protein